MEVDRISEEVIMEVLVYGEEVHSKRGHLGNNYCYMGKVKITMR